jgi:hypothetical protein
LDDNQDVWGGSGMVWAIVAAVAGFLAACMWLMR